jgi:tRNA threonylcarbamoyladenosine biosynthesis protein TsaE
VARIVHTRNVTETEALAADLVKSLRRGTVVALHGPLGAGKTAFVRGLAAGLGITGTVTSPSFTIVCEYAAQLPLIHVDLYRTDSDEELELLGFDELLSREAIVAVEWAEKAARFLPIRCVDVDISVDHDGRIIRIDGLATA